MRLLLPVIYPTSSLFPLPPASSFLHSTILRPPVLHRSLNPDTVKRFRGVRGGTGVRRSIGESGGSGSRSRLVFAH